MTRTAEMTVIAGGKDDFLQVQHLKLTGSYTEMGAALARIARDQLEVTKAPWTDPEATASQRRYFEQHWPQHYQRMIGAAREFGADLEDPSLDFSFLAYDVGVPGCSVVYYPPRSTEDGHGVLSRNYDFTIGTVSSQQGMSELGKGRSGGLLDRAERPIASRPFLIETHPSQGYSTLYMSCNDLLGGATDGINSEGLSVALLMDAETLYGPTYNPTHINTVGFGESNIPLYLLETCATAEEARIALSTMLHRYVASPCHYIICDLSGDSFVWEYGLNRNRTHVVRSNGAPLCVTNHLLHEHEDQRRELIEESIGRLETLKSATDNPERTYSKSEITEINRRVDAVMGVGEGQYANDIFPSRTLWYAQYDVEDRTLEIDFYLGESDGRIQRSESQRFSLAKG